MRAGLVCKIKSTHPVLFSLLVLVLPIAVLGVVSASAHAQLDDPTRPPGHRLVLPGGKKATKDIKFSLSSVYISSVRRTAVINDRRVEQGDHVNGAKVVEILPAAVKLKRQGKVFTVRLLSQVVKKTRTR